MAPDSPLKNMSVLVSLQCARLMLSLQNIAQQDPKLMGQLMSYRFPVRPSVYSEYAGFPLLLDRGHLCLGTILHGITTALTGKALLMGTLDGVFTFALTNFPPQQESSLDADLAELMRAPFSTKDSEQRVARFIRDLSSADPRATDMIMGMSAPASPAMAKLLGGDSVRPFRVSIEQLVLSLINVTLAAATSTLTVGENGVMGLVSHYPQNHESASCSA